MLLSPLSTPSWLPCATRLHTTHLSSPRRPRRPRLPRPSPVTPPFGIVPALRYAAPYRTHHPSPTTHAASAPSTTFSCRSSAPFFVSALRHAAPQNTHLQSLTTHAASAPSTTFFCHPCPLHRACPTPRGRTCSHDACCGSNAPPICTSRMALPGQAGAQHVDAVDVIAAGGALQQPALGPLVHSTLTPRVPQESTVSPPPTPPPPSPSPRAHLQRLRARGSELVVRTGDTAAVVGAVARAVGASRVYSHTQVRRVQPRGRTSTHNFCRGPGSECAGV
jgi:hypothetical protein